jgi:hypothetical protein
VIAIAMTANDRAKALNAAAKVSDTLQIFTPAVCGKTEIPWATGESKLLFSDCTFLQD